MTQRYLTAIAIGTVLFILGDVLIVANWFNG